MIDVKLILLLKYAPGLTKGMQLVDNIRWSNLDVDAAMQGDEQLFDAAKIIDMISYVLDNSYVNHKGAVYRQVTGMPMGVNCAPQQLPICTVGTMSYVTWYAPQ